MKMRNTTDLPPGPRRDLHQALFDLYQATEQPTAELVGRWARTQRRPAGISRTTVGQLLQGLTANLATWETVRALAVGLLGHAINELSDDDKRQALADIKKRYRAVRPLELDLDPPRPQQATDEAVPWRNSFESSGSPNTAEHFARTGYGWAYEASGGVPHYLQGAVAISAVEAQPSAARHLFATDFQYWLARLADQKLLRKDGVAFHGMFERTPYSCIHYGTMKRREVESFVAIEVFAESAVSVYFREAITDGTLEEALVYWVQGSWQLALHVAHLLGLRGQAYGSTILCRSGVDILDRTTVEGGQTEDDEDARSPHSFIEVTHDPLDLVPESFSDTVFPFGWADAAAWAQTQIAREELHHRFPSLVSEYMDVEKARETWNRIIYR